MPIYKCASCKSTVSLNDNHCPSCGSKFLNDASKQTESDMLDFSGFKSGKYGWNFDTFGQTYIEINPNKFHIESDWAGHGQFSHTFKLKDWKMKKSIFLNYLKENYEFALYDGDEPYDGADVSRLSDDKLVNPKLWFNTIFQDFALFVKDSFEPEYGDEYKSELENLDPAYEYYNEQVWLKPNFHLL